MTSPMGLPATMVVWCTPSAATPRGSKVTMWYVSTALSDIRRRQPMRRTASCSVTSRYMSPNWARSFSVINFTAPSYHEDCTVWMPSQEGVLSSRSPYPAVFLAGRGLYLALPHEFNVGFGAFPESPIEFGVFAVDIAEYVHGVACDVFCEPRLRFNMARELDHDSELLVHCFGVPDAHGEETGKFGSAFVALECSLDVLNINKKGIE